MKEEHPPEEDRLSDYCTNSIQEKLTQLRDEAQTEADKYRNTYDQMTPDNKNYMDISGCYNYLQGAAHAYQRTLDILGWSAKATVVRHERLMRDAED